MRSDVVRIGGASGFWGDSLDGARQLIMQGEIDFLVFDYLAEITMSLLARMRARKPELGFVPDFTDAVGPLLRTIKERGIRVVTNSGGVNPRAAAAALAARAKAEGVDLKIAVVTGDDLHADIEKVRATGVREMFTGEPMPARLLSANAYLGAKPIADALDRGAEVIITGRCVDSAVTLGILVHRFGWKWDNWDGLAQASLAGHLIECSTQVTGGIFTDWRDVPGWDDMGFPIAECRADGSFVITKPERTGGLVTPLSVGEQMLYEIGDPASYMLPDVTCDFRAVQMRQLGSDRVEVTGAVGRPPSDTLKVSATYPDGFRSIGTVTIAGRDAAAKAQRAGEAIFQRARRLLAVRQMADFTQTSIEILGSESVYGANAAKAASRAREVVLKLGAMHPEEKALELFAREVAPAASAMAQGLTGFFAGRPAVQPVVRLYSFLWPKSAVTPVVEIGGAAHEVRFDPVPAAEGRFEPEPQQSAERGGSNATAKVPLVALAVGRSGDKGNTANIGLIARKPSYLPFIKAALTADRIKTWFAHCGVTRVDRFDLPGMSALNYVLHDALGGGGVASLRIDPQGKAFAQMLMDIEIPVPPEIAADVEAQRGKVA